MKDKYNNQEEYKWKCDICGTGFNNFHAQGFDNQIYCPLCYYKKLYSDYKNCWEEFKQKYSNKDYVIKNLKSINDVVYDLEKENGIESI